MQITNTQNIRRHIFEVRENLSNCSSKFGHHFNAEIVRTLRLADIRAYSNIVDSFYLFEDTELAKEHIRSNLMGLDFGLAYLKFYGVMNACYLQQQAAIVCCEKLQIDFDTSALTTARVLQFRNDFAAHSPNRGRGVGIHSFILDKFGLVEGRVSGYSSNSPDGFISRDAKIVDIVSEWDDLLEPALAVINNTIATRIKIAEGNSAYIGIRN